MRETHVCTEFQIQVCTPLHLDLGPVNHILFLNITFPILHGCNLRNNEAQRTLLFPFFFKLKLYEILLRLVQFSKCLLR